MENADKKEKMEEDVDEKLLEMVGNILSEDDAKGKTTDHSIVISEKIEREPDASKIDLDREIEELEMITLDDRTDDEPTIKKPFFIDNIKEKTPVEDVQSTKQPELARDEIIAFFKSIPRVGLVTATRIVDSGYDSYGSLSTMEEESFKGIPDVGAELAVKITERVKQRFPPLTEKKEEPVQEELKTEETAPVPAEKEVKEQEEDGNEKGKEDEKTKEGSGEETGKEVQEETKEKETKKETGEGGGLWGKVKGLFKRKGKDKSESETPASDKGEDGSQLPTLEEVGDEKIESGSETASDTSDSETTAEDSVKISGEDVVSPVTTEDRKEIAQEEEKEKEVSIEVEAKDEPDKAAGSPVEEFVGKLDIERNIAKEIFDAGYNDLGDLREAIPEDLEFVDGIDGPLAVKICNRIKELDI